MFKFTPRIARCCYISKTEPQKFFIATSWDTLSDKKIKANMSIFNMRKSYTFVDVQVTEEGGWD